MSAPEGIQKALATQRLAPAGPVNQKRLKKAAKGSTKTDEVFQAHAPQIAKAATEADLAAKIEALKGKINQIIEGGAQAVISEKMGVAREVLQLKNCLQEHGVDKSSVDTLIEKKSEEIKENAERLAKERGIDKKGLLGGKRTITRQVRQVEAEIGKELDALTKALRKEIGSLSETEKSNLRERVAKVQARAETKEVKEAIEQRIREDLKISRIYKRVSPFKAIAKFFRKIRGWFVRRLAMAPINKEVKRILKGAADEETLLERLPIVWDACRTSVEEKLKAKPYQLDKKISPKQLDHFIEESIRSRLTKQCGVGRAHQAKMMRNINHAEEKFQRAAEIRQHLVEKRSELTPNTIRYLEDEQVKLFGEASSLLLEKIPPGEMPLEHLALMEVSPGNSEVMTQVWYKSLADIYDAGELAEIGFEGLQKKIEKQLSAAENYLVGKRLLASVKVEKTPLKEFKGLEDFQRTVLKKLDSTVELESTAQQIKHFFYVHANPEKAPSGEEANAYFACYSQIVAPFLDTYIGAFAKDFETLKELLITPAHPFRKQLIFLLQKEIGAAFGEGKVSRAQQAEYTPPKIEQLIENRCELVAERLFKLDAEAIRTLKSEALTAALIQKLSVKRRGRFLKIPILKLSVAKASEAFLKAQLLKYDDSIKSKKERVKEVLAEERADLLNTIETYEEERGVIQKLLDQWSDDVEVREELIKDEESKKFTLFPLDNYDLTQLNRSEQLALWKKLENKTLPQLEKSIDFLKKAEAQSLEDIELENIGKIKEDISSLQKEAIKLTESQKSLEKVLWPKEGELDDVVEIPSLTIEITKASKEEIKFIKGQNKSKIGERRKKLELTANPSKIKFLNKKIKESEKENRFIDEILQNWKNRKLVCKKHKDFILTTWPEGFVVQEVPQALKRAVLEKHGKLVEEALKHELEAKDKIRSKIGQLENIIGVKRYLELFFLEIPSIKFPVAEASEIFLKAQEKKYIGNIALKRKKLKAAKGKEKHKLKKDLETYTNELKVIQNLLNNWSEDSKQRKHLIKEGELQEFSFFPLDLYDPTELNKNERAAVHKKVIDKLEKSKSSLSMLEKKSLKDMELKDIENVEEDLKFLKKSSLKITKEIGKISKRVISPEENDLNENIMLPSLTIKISRANKDMVQFIKRQNVNEIEGFKGKIKAEGDEKKIKALKKRIKKYEGENQFINEVLQNWDNREMISRKHEKITLGTRPDAFIIGKIPNAIKGIVEHLLAKLDENELKAKELISKEIGRVTEEIASIKPKLSGKTTSEILEKPFVTERDRAHWEKMTMDVVNLIGKAEVDPSIDLFNLSQIPIKPENEKLVLHVWKKIATRLFEGGRLERISKEWLSEDEVAEMTPFVKKYLELKRRVTTLSHGLSEKGREQLNGHLKGLEVAIDVAGFEKLSAPRLTAAKKAAGVKSGDLNELERAGLQLLMRGLAQLDEERPVQFTQNEKEQLHDFILHAKNNMVLNKKISKLKKQKPIPYGLNNDALEFVRTFTYKSKFMPSFAPTVKKLEQRWKLIDDSNLSPKGRLTLKDWAALHQLGRTSDQFEKLQKLGILEARPKSDFTKDLKGVIKAHKIYKSIDKEIRERFHKDSENKYHSGDIMFRSKLGEKKYESKPLDHEDRFYVLFLSGVGHVAKIYRTKKAGEEIDQTRYSHTVGGYRDEEANYTDLAYSKVYRLDTSKFVTGAALFHLEAMWGDDWKTELDSLYREIEAKLHTTTQEQYEHVKYSHTKVIKAFKAKLKFWKSKRTKERNFSKLHAKVYGKSEKKFEKDIFCSEFAGKTTIAALLELEKQLREKIREHIKADKELSGYEDNWRDRAEGGWETALELPFSGRERLKHLHPGRLLEILKKKKCVTRVKPPGFLQRLMEVPK